MTHHTLLPYLLENKKGAHVKRELGSQAGYRTVYIRRERAAMIPQLKAFPCTQDRSLSSFLKDLPSVADAVPVKLIVL